MTDKAVEEIQEKFNGFIKKWCGNYYPHLIDTDENDGEEFRQFVARHVHSLIVRGKVEELKKFYIFGYNNKEFACALANRIAELERGEVRKIN